MNRVVLGLMLATLAGGAVRAEAGLVDRWNSTTVTTAMRAAGALAAKQTGAGLGGMLLALCTTEAEAQAVAAAIAPRIRTFWTLAIYPEHS